jgi:hypothetical protein
MDDVQHKMPVDLDLLVDSGVVAIVAPSVKAPSKRGQKVNLKAEESGLDHEEKSLSLIFHIHPAHLVQ